MVILCLSCVAHVEVVSLRSSKSYRLLICLTWVVLDSLWLRLNSSSKFFPQSSFLSFYNLCKSLFLIYREFSKLQISKHNVLGAFHILDYKESFIIYFNVVVFILRENIEERFNLLLFDPMGL